MKIKGNKGRKFPYDKVGYVIYPEYDPDNLEFSMEFIPQGPEDIPSNLKIFSCKKSFLIEHIEHMKAWLFDDGFAFNFELAFSQLTEPEIQMVIENKYKVIYRIRMVKTGLSGKFSL